MAYMIDIHCHILYGVDDGAELLDESIKMAENAVAGGTKTLVVTPHCNVPKSFQNYVDEEFLKRFEDLEELIANENIPLKLLRGQEIYCNDRALSLLKKRKLLTINDTDYVLLEFDFDENSENIFRRLEGIVSAGYMPIIAHPERYRFLQEDYSCIVRLKDLGCLIQLNKGSVFGVFGQKAQMFAHMILNDELADVVASDAHSPYMRTPYLREVHEYISVHFSIDYADLLLAENPQKIIDGEVIL